MRTLLFLAIAWMIASIVLGISGASHLQRLRKDRVETELDRISQSIRLIVEEGDWGERPDSDPRWQEMQRRLGVSVIPQRVQKPIQPQGIAWVQLPGGGYRVVESIECDDKTDALGMLQISRELLPASEVTSWLLGWVCLNAAALMFAVAGFWKVYWETESNQRLMDPWIASAQRERPDSDLILAEIDERESRLSTSMAIIGESVNRVYLELKRANERSELVFCNLSEGVLAVDDQALVLLANRSLLKLLKLSDEPYLYRPLLEVIRVPVLCNLVESVLKDASPRDEEVELGNQPTFLRILARPLPLGESKYGALLTVRDETMIKRVELIRRDFVANASHELKTPLSAIRAYAETLQLGALQDQDVATSFAGNIVAQADRMNNLLQGMLQLSRAEVGGALNFKPFNAREALEACLAAARALAQAKGVHVTVQSSSEPIMLESDRDGFQTIASNLLSNAVRYTEPGGSVWVKLLPRSTDIVLEVRDTGIGMKQSDLERAFERFYRAHKDRSSDTGGTGLGLSMVKHLAQALGGSVSATSQPNKGSTFVVRLPIQRVTE